MTEILILKLTTYPFNYQVTYNSVNSKKHRGTSRIENIADELGMVLFSGLAICESPVSDS